ncbi:MAG: hypothetical protein Aurels2KO_29630 [Aureliella sp.]
MLGFAVDSSCVSRRRGLQLLELTVAMSVAALLVASVSTAIAIASVACTEAGDDLARLRGNSLGIQQLADELAFARRVVSVDASSAELEMGTGVGGTREVHYLWEGESTPLLRSIDGEKFFAVSDPLDDFNLRLHTVDEPKQSAESNRLELNAARTTFLSFVTRCSIPVPATYQAGDLVVAVVAYRKDDTQSVKPEAGWDKLHASSASGETTLFVFASRSDVSKFAASWTSRGDIGVTLLHFAAPEGSGGNLNFSLASRSDSGSQVVCDGLDVGTQEQLVIRAGAFRGRGYAYTSGMPGFNFGGKIDTFLSDLCLIVAYTHASGTLPEGALISLGSKRYTSLTIAIEQ